MALPKTPHSMNEEQIGQLEIIEPTALESIERANVDIQISTAHRYPRSLAVTKKRMLELATLDEETAMSCFYKLNRQGKSIEGPSIRLAEIAASAYGNLRFGARVISDNGKQITAQGFCHDLESNVLSTIEVKRRITNREGQRYSDDMIVVTGNAACAIAARNAIFKVVPFAIIKPIFEAAKRTAIGDLTTLADRRSKMLEKFAAIGVNQKQIVASVTKKGIEEIGLDELETLIGVFNAIKDGDQTVEEAFAPVDTRAPINFGQPREETEPAGATQPESHAEQPQSARPRGRPKKIRDPEVADHVATGSPPTLTPKDEPGPFDGGPTQVVVPPPKEEKPAPPRATPIQGLRNLMTSSQVEEKDVLAYLFSEMRCEQGQTLDQLPVTTIQYCIDSWLPIVEQIKS
jgi:hypothetical protein